MVRRLGFVWLFGLATTWLLGCEKLCEEAMFARDPNSGECIALSECYLTDAQRTWERCDEDPCVGLDENSCLDDRRCQPGYALPGVKGVKDYDRVKPLGCVSDFTFTPPPQPDDPIGVRTTLGVNNGEPGKYPGVEAFCFRGNSQVYAGCRAVPQISTEKPCTRLTWAECRARRDCTDQPSFSSDGQLKKPADPAATGQCFDGNPRNMSCENFTATPLQCLTNPNCEAIGTHCYCPPGAKCDCRGGDFLYCLRNDRLRRCASNAECNPDERCDNDEVCIVPRVWDTPPPVPIAPGSPGCVGACVPAGCTGMGEEMCNASPACDVGSYTTLCSASNSYYSDPRFADPSSLATSCNGSPCSCSSQFANCAPRTSNFNQRAERSLLVRDPEIIDDPAFSLMTVMTRLAPAGQVNDFAHSLLAAVGAEMQVQNGAKARWRAGFSHLYGTIAFSTMAQKFSSMMMTTALINRLDLASATDCGQARLSYAMNRAYRNGSQRMTLIVELIVPDDGNGCKTVAQRWAELAYIDDLAQRRTRLLALYGELLKPANLGQIRTNEFLNSFGSEPWELREFHLDPRTGLLQMTPVAQTLNPQQTNSQELLAWLRANGDSLKAGTATLPTQFLAAASTEDGGRLRLDTEKDLVMLGVEKKLNELSCAGCHLTETTSGFVHIGERLAKKIGNDYVPVGRAVIDSFMQQELVKRMVLLDGVLTGTHGLTATDWRPRVQTRVH